MESFKEIEGYENYHIYDDGRVWSCCRGKGKFLKPGTRDGYKHVVLCKNGKMKNMNIHRLVAVAFIPNPENKPQVDHIDQCRTNNHVSNLRWATNSENQQNRGKSKNNTSGHKNVCKLGDGWLFRKIIHGVETQKYFKTLDDAINFKLKFEFFYLIKNNTK